MIHKFTTIDVSNAVGTAFPTIGSENLDIRAMTFLKSYDGPLPPDASRPDLDDFPIRFRMHNPDLVSIRIFDRFENEVRTFPNRRFQTGEHTINWDLKNNKQQLIPQGKYYYILTKGSQVEFGEF